MLIPQNTGLIQELSSGPERGRAFGILGATVGLATAAGPVIDGLILATVPGADNWRWVFYVNVPIGFVALMFAGSPRTGQCRYAPARPSGTCPALLLGGGVLSLLIPVVDTGDGETSQL